jgi:acyl-CoA synthetase (AMP-forming)/AMP-acid ligase II
MTERLRSGTAGTTPSSLYDLLSSRAAQGGRSIAISAPGRPQLSYEKLLQQTEYVVGALNSVGVGRGDRVAIVLPNGPEMAVAFIGVCACSTSAPLNPGYRRSEFEYYLADLNAKALLVQAGVESDARLAAAERSIPLLELHATSHGKAGLFRLTGGTTSHPRRSGIAEAQDVALVLHTSGTTSKPKIVPLSHDNLCASARNICEALNLTEADTCLNIMPLFHIHGLVAAVLSSLAAGACVVCTPGFYAPQFYGWLDEYHPPHITQVHSLVICSVSSERNGRSGSHFRGTADRGVRYDRGRASDGE